MPKISETSIEQFLLFINARPSYVCRKKLEKKPVIYVVYERFNLNLLEKSNIFSNSWQYIGFFYDFEAAIMCSFKPYVKFFLIFVWLLVKFYLSVHFIGQISK